MSRPEIPPDGAESAPVVSFLVTVFDKAAVLGETLAALRAQVGLASFEIVAVDDGSRDGGLALLREAAAREPRLRVLGGDDNLGPAVRLNQAAAAARGRWLLPVDGDDLLAPNAAAWMIARAEAAGAEAVFGQARRGPAPPPVPTHAETRVYDAPLAFAAAAQLSHMGFLARRALWAAAGGADEGVFIQDQSVQLRLCRAARRVLGSPALVYGLRPPDAGALSRNRAQQHHDRYLSAWRVLRDLGPAERAAAGRALRGVLLSALWKLRRDGFVQGPGPAALSAAHLRYLAFRGGGRGPDDRFFARQADALAGLGGVRRP